MKDERNDWVGSQIAGESDASYAKRVRKRKKNAQNWTRKSKHSGHTGVRRAPDGRIYCPPCEARARRTSERRKYHREYQRKRRGYKGPKSWRSLIVYFSGRPAKRLMSPKELADAIHISEQTVRGWVRKGWLDVESVKNDTGKGLWRTRSYIVTE